MVGALKVVAAKVVEGLALVEMAKEAELVKEEGQRLRCKAVWRFACFGWFGQR